MKRMFLILIVLFVGCGGSGSKGSGGGEADATGKPDLFLHDQTEGTGELDIPSEAPQQNQCQSDQDCKDLGKDYYCNCKHQCIKGECAENKNCGSDYYCDPCDKKCHPRSGVCEPCEEDYQCQEEMVCVKDVLSQPFCAQQCVPHGSCPVKYKCMDVGLGDVWACVPKSMSCGSTEQCKKDEDCPFGQICHPDTHMCISAQCEKDNECPQGKVCEMGRCIDACSQASDCEKNQKPDWASDRPWICEEGHCKIEGACFTPYDCKEPETYCDGQTHQCKPGCKIDYDCKDASKICVNGHCVDKGCEHNFDCAFGQVCNKATGKCEDAPEIFCKECTPDKQGQNLAGDCPDQTAICLTLKDKDGNEKGSFCFPPCQGDPKGVDACPQGYQCAEIKVQNQQTGQSKVYHQCVRACYANQQGQGQ